MGCAECGAPDGRCTDDCLMLQDQDRAVGRATADLRAEVERLTRERDEAQRARGLTEEAADSLEEERVSLCADRDEARQALAKFADLVRGLLAEHDATNHMFAPGERPDAPITARIRAAPDALGRDAVVARTKEEMESAA